MKNKFSERPDNIKEELKLRKTTRKNINEVEKLETETKEMKNIKTEMIEYKSYKLLGDLNMEKGIETEEIKEIEIKLAELKIPKTVVNKFQKTF